MFNVAGKPYAAKLAQTNAPAKKAPAGLYARIGTGQIRKLLNTEQEANHAQPV